MNILRKTWRIPSKSFFMSIFAKMVNDMALKNRQFSITAINILGTCDPHLRKILEPGYYFFNEWCTISQGDIILSPNKNPEKYFFGKNISIQAIVGKNGSGKSSILELMYRIINNFGYMLVRRQRRRAAEVLYFIEGLYADLHFVIGDDIGVLYCRGGFIGFHFGEDKIFFGDNDPLFSDFIDQNSIKNEKVIEIAKSFFYSIVTNYSIQSFIDSDFRTEQAHRFESDEISGIDSSAIWINSLFHKNDGYITPIVLNPYRDEGTLDLKKEYQLTNYRLSAILIEANNTKKQFIDEYQLHSIEYQYDPMLVFIKFEEGRKKNAVLDDFLREFILISYNDKTFSSIILNEFGCKVSPELNDVQVMSNIYLVYKTLSIASKYPSFNEYENLGIINNYKKEATAEEKDKLIDLVREIKNENSHITVKIRQTLHFLKIDLKKLSFKKSEYDFTYEQYIKSLDLKSSLKGLDIIMEHLPPPFFTFNIKLDKVKNNKKISEEPILFQRMSSGERQFIYTVSTFIYHIKNLLSIQQSNRVKYRNINLILDEVEICFHPEYQRLFIDKLIRTLQRLHLNTHCSFNIIIATHSPFILSDVLKSNILYLKEGKSVDKSEFNSPFGANINDILHQSFFLENGFIGEYAKKQIESLLNYLTSERKTLWTKDSAQEIINFIGEPIIRNQLQFLFNEKFRILEENKDIEIARLKKEIDFLKARK